MRAHPAFVKSDASGRTRIVDSSIFEAIVSAWVPQNLQRFTIDYAGSARIGGGGDIKYTPPAVIALPASKLVAGLAAINCGWPAPKAFCRDEKGVNAWFPLWPGSSRHDNPRSRFTGNIDPWVATGLAADWMVRGVNQTTVLDRYTIERTDPEALADLEAATQRMIDWLFATAEQLHSMLGDLYEAMLGGMLQIARSQGIKDVWLLDYETKYAMAAYSKSIAPPRSVYTDLPKRFQVATAQPLPVYMDISSYDERRTTVSRAGWKEVDPPEAPRGRRLIPNR
jgi:hypothetical protein